MRVVLFCVLTAGLAGCTELPDIEDGVTAADEAAEYPELIALSPDRVAQVDEEDETPATLEARAASLRGRAAGLTAPVLSSDERARLNSTVQ